MLLRRLSIASLSLFALARCGGAAEEPATFESTSESEATAAPAVLRFLTNFTSTLEGDLVQGGQVRVIYEASRLPQCRGDRNGRPAWSITALWSLNGGAAQSRAIGGLDPNGSRVSDGQIVIDLPAAGDLAFWFTVTSSFGCQAWDSAYGQNYHFRVLAKPAGVIHFNKDWSEVVEGKVKRGATVGLDFDLSRLPFCRQTYNGFGTWNVSAFYRFDGGAVREASVVHPDGMTQVPMVARVEVPAAARTLEVWFKNTDRAGCVAYDSDFGKNYKFATSN